MRFPGACPACGRHGDSTLGDCPTCLHAAPATIGPAPAQADIPATIVGSDLSTTEPQSFASLGGEAGPRDACQDMLADSLVTRFDPPDLRDVVGTDAARR